MYSGPWYARLVYYVGQWLMVLGMGWGVEYDPEQDTLEIDLSTVEKIDERKVIVQKQYHREYEALEAMRKTLEES